MGAVRKDAWDLNPFPRKLNLFLKNEKRKYIPLSNFFTSSIFPQMFPFKVWERIKMKNISRKSRTHLNSIAIHTSIRIFQEANVYRDEGRECWKRYFQYYMERNVPEDKVYTKSSSE